MQRVATILPDYHYLVSRNRILFPGRGRGAQFCAKNSFTRGICVPGDYSTSLLRCGFTSVEGAIVSGDLEIHPNPSKGKIYFSGYVEAPIVIFGAQGQQLFHGKMDPLDYSIKPDLSPGLYFLRIEWTGVSEIIVVE